MATTITSAIQLTYQLASSENQTVTDQGGIGRTVTVGSGWFRIFIAPNTGVAGTSSTSPTGFTVFVQAALNTGAGGTVYTVSVDANGFVTIKYSGTGTAVITWHANHVVRNLLGFTGTTLTIPTGTTQTATYHPTHTLYMVGRANDTNWQDVQQRRAGSEMPDGTTVILQDGAQRMVRSFDSLAHPIDWSTRSSLGMSATPWLPDSSTRQSTPDASAGVAPPWSALDMIAGFGSVNGNAMGALFGTYQTALSGSTTTFDRIYATVDCLNRSRRSSPMQANNANHIKIEGLAFYRKSVDSL